MKKTALALFVLITLLLLTACVDAKVTYSLDENFVTDTQMEVVIKHNNLQSRNYADDILEYWDRLGFNTNSDETSDKITLNAENQQNYKDMPTSAGEFAKSLTSPSSIFSDAHFEYTPSFEHDMFKLNASVDLQDVIRQHEMQDIPQNDIDELVAQAKEGSYKLSVILPGQPTHTNADEQEGNICTWNLEYGKKFNIILETKLTNSTAIDEYNQLKQQKSSNSMLFRSTVAAAGFLLMLIIVFAVVRAVRKRR